LAPGLYHIVPNGVVIVVVQWVRRKELLDLPIPVLAVFYSLFFAWISTGIIGAVLAYFVPALRHCAQAFL
jgi:hypothetical protein